MPGDRSAKTASREPGAATRTRRQPSAVRCRSRRRALRTAAGRRGDTPRRPLEAWSVYCPRHASWTLFVPSGAVAGCFPSRILPGLQTKPAPRYVAVGARPASVPRRHIWPTHRKRWLRLLAARRTVEIDPARWACSVEPPMLPLPPRRGHLDRRPARRGPARAPCPTRGGERGTARSGADTRLGSVAHRGGAAPASWSL